MSSSPKNQTPTNSQTHLQNFSFQNQNPRKMSSKAKQFLNLTTPEATNFTVPDLITHLRWTTLPDDFSLVVNLLSAKEVTAKKAYSLLEEKHAALTDELKSRKNENVELREQMLRSKDEYESCIAELRGRIEVMERDERKADDLVKLYRSRFRKLILRVARLEDDAKVLLMSDEPREDEEEVRGTDAMSNASPMRDEKGETEGQLTEDLASASKENKKDEPSSSKPESGMPDHPSSREKMIVGVTSLEDDAKVTLMSDQPRVEEEVRGTNALSNASLMDDQMGETEGQPTEELASASKEKKKDEASSSKPESEMPVIFDLKNESQSEAAGKTLAVSDTIDANNKMVLPSNGKNSTRVVIEIIDSDDEQPVGIKTSPSRLKRKGGSPFGGVDDDGSRLFSQIPGGKKKLSHDLNIKLKKLCGSMGPTALSASPSNSVEASGTSSKRNSGVLRPCEEKITSELTSEPLLSQIKNFAREDSSSDDSDDDTWRNETDMIVAIEKNAQLCMRAICALYREKAFKSMELQDAPNNEKLIALRGTNLAEFLINGDPGAKLKRSIFELHKKDEKGLLDCKRIAIVYSKKLFEIFKIDKDNFCPPFF